MSDISTLKLNGTVYNIKDATARADAAAAQATANAAIPSAEKGAASGVAPLNAQSKIDSTYLPSYVDDVIEGYYHEGKFYSDASFQTEIPAESGKIYIDKLTNISYRWSGTQYVAIAGDLALGTTHANAYYGDYGQAAYEHSQVTSGNPHNVSLSDLEITASAQELNYMDGVTSNVQTQLDTKGTYSKPENGIPKTDLTSDVQTSLGKADTAIQDISGKQDLLISGTNIKTLNNESLLGSGNIELNNAVWGNISGTLSDQTDLSSALDGKQKNIYQQASAPSNPSSGDIWIDTDESGSPVSVSWGDIQGTLSNQTDLQDVLDAKIPISQKGANGGVAELDSNSKVPLSQLPDGIGNLFIAVEDVTTYDEIVAAVAAGKNVVLRRQRDNSDKFWQLSEIYHYPAQEVEEGAENRIVFMRTDSTIIEEGADLEDLCVRKTKVYKDNSGNTIYSTDTGIFTPTVYDMEQKQDVISDLETIRSGAALGATSIQSSAKGVSGGVAELDSNGKVPSSQLPSYVDDVLEYATMSNFPVEGEAGKIYVALDTNKTYRWSGTSYVEISESLALGETSSTAYRGDRGKDAYDHSQLTSGNPHNVGLSDLGITSSAEELNYTDGVTSNIQTQLDSKMRFYSSIAEPSNASVGDIWKVVEPPNYLCFTAEEANSTIKMSKVETPVYSPTIQYSTDRNNWNTFTIGSTTVTLANIGDKVWFKGNNTRINPEPPEEGSDPESYYYFEMTGKIAASGNIQSLLDETAEKLDVPAGCYYRLFYECTSLTAAPLLPATTLGEDCYGEMFSCCTSLTTAPELPATTLATWCYYAMFDCCTSLTTLPVLPATILAQACYYAMFNNCTSLTTPPALPATSLATYCYQQMFYYCTSLTTAPSLPATALADYCYAYMFYGCTSLTTAPSLPATTLADYCYASMFALCESLTTVPSLPATVLAEGCYCAEEAESYGMFGHCSSLKVYSSSGEGHTNLWRIPTSGSATGSYTSQNRVFYSTNGDYSSTSSIDFSTTNEFYTQNPPV